MIRINNNIFLSTALLNQQVEKEDAEILQNKLETLDQWNGGADGELLSFILKASREDLQHIANCFPLLITNGLQEIKSLFSITAKYPCLEYSSYWNLLIQAPTIKWSTPEIEETLSFMTGLPQEEQTVLQNISENRPYETSTLLCLMKKIYETQKYGCLNLFEILFISEKKSTSYHSLLENLHKLFREIVPIDTETDTGISAINAQEICETVQAFYDNQTVKRQHVFLNSGIHCTPIYLEKTEMGTVRMLITDSAPGIYVTFYDLHNQLTQMQGKIDRIYFYSLRRLNARMGCIICALRDAVKTFKRQHQPGCQTIFEWIENKGNVQPYRGSTMTSTFDTLPPEYLKIAQSRIFIPAEKYLHSRDATLQSVQLTFHTTIAGVRLEQPENYTALYNTIIKHQDQEGRNQHATQLRMKYLLRILSP